MTGLEGGLKDAMAMVIRLLKSKEFIEGLFLICIVSKLFKTMKD